jgi:exonuclease SbcC
LIREGLRRDVPRFMRLEVLYDQKPLERTSFGQRCTAVLVVLLSMGNRPIIVDEPEAHLDSALIATFMVDLIKRVKSQRQIIFATHNANFVVNGDAELVNALATATGEPTTIRPTTIENLDTRSLILNLEGGESAFLQREGRYRLA